VQDIQRTTGATSWFSRQEKSVHTERTLPGEDRPPGRRGSRSLLLSARAARAAILPRQSKSPFSLTRGISLRQQIAGAPTESLLRSRPEARRQPAENHEFKPRRIEERTRNSSDRAMLTARCRAAACWTCTSDLQPGNLSRPAPYSSASWPSFQPAEQGRFERDASGYRVGRNRGSMIVSSCPGGKKRIRVK